MKESIKALNLLMLAVFLLQHHVVFTQSIGPQGVHVKAVKDGNGHVRLRWAPSDFKVFLQGNTHGYYLERYTVAINGNYLTIEDMIASKKDLKHHQPLTESEWDQYSANNEIAGVAQAAIFGENFTPTIAGDELSTIMNTNSQAENRINFGLFAADQDFEVAQLMRLAFIDESVSADHTYQYKVTAFKEPDPKMPWGATTINMQEDYILPAPEGLTVRMENKVAMLYLPKSNLEKYYSSYNIQLDSGSGWETRNDKPKVYLADDENLEHMVFTDTVPELGVEYKYRIVGRSPFGLVDVPPSNEVSAIAQYPPLGVSPDLTTCEQDGSRLFLKWDFPADLEPKLHSFAIMRATEADGHYEQVGETNKKARDFHDESPSPLSNYYKVVGIDEHQGKNPSLPKLGQMNDEVPPVKPVGLEGTVSKDGLVKLTWEAGQDPDLKGYRVYFSNNKESEFTQLTGAVLVGTSFETKLELNTLGKEVYYQIIAVDFRDNESVPSNVITIKRPDVIPPVKPVLRNVNPLPAGVALDWIQSSSDDISKHEVQRKYPTDDNWITLRSIAFGQKDSVYLDSMTVGPDPVKYRIVAVDRAGLPAASEQITVTPVRVNADTIVNFKIFSSVDGDKKQAKLVWEYGSPEKMREFQIYRSLATGEPHFYTISKVDLAEVVIDPVTKRGIFIYKDKDITEGTLYKYRILGKFNSGASTQLSQTKQFTF
jgi:uncharacterized protein